jgi:pimeloyl-ACP methyl ester carboxylesterase
MARKVILLRQVLVRMNNLRLIVDGLDIEYSDRGAGQTLLFLHGWSADAESFNALIEQFENERCIALSLPGFGRSELPKTDWRVFDYALFTRKFLDKLNIEPDVIIAHSFGGRVAIKAVSSGILNPGKLVLIASAGMARKSVTARIAESIAKIFKIFTALPPGSFFKKYLRQIIASKDYANAGPMRGTFSKVVSERLEEDAKKITTPTLLIWGEKDKETPLSEANELQKSIRGSRLEIIPGAEHFVFQEMPDVVSQKIKKFLL